MLGTLAAATASPLVPVALGASLQGTAGPCGSNLCQPVILVEPLAMPIVSPQPEASVVALAHVSLLTNQIPRHYKRANQ